MEINNGKKSDNLEENWKTKLSKNDEFIAKESRRFNISVLINYQQDLKMMIPRTDHQNYQ